MSIREIGIVMNGVTGRMGTNQHLMRSLCAIRDDGGIRLTDGTSIVPVPILVGRDEHKLHELALRAGGVRWTTNLEAALEGSQAEIYFDSQVTHRRVEAVALAIDAGKHIYCEKPTATTASDALALYHRAELAGVKHGVVQDKLWLPGMVKLKSLIDTGYFGRVLSVRGEFGYWVFTGGLPSHGGDGIIVDMLCHWRYVLDNLFGSVKAVSCTGATHHPVRWNEDGQEYRATADDAAYATFELSGGVIVQFNSSWCTRVRRDDLLTIQVDGTHGSAVAGLRECRLQHSASTPRPVWNPDQPGSVDYLQNWTPMPETQHYKNAFRAQWELFLKHVVLDTPFPWNLLEAAKGVQLAECGLESWRSRRWVDVGEIH